MDFSFDFSSLDLSIQPQKDDAVSEFLRSAKISKKPVMYDNALKAAQDINLEDD